MIEKYRKIGRFLYNIFFKILNLLNKFEIIIKIGGDTVKVENCEMENYRISLPNLDYIIYDYIIFVYKKMGVYKQLYISKNLCISSKPHYLVKNQ